MPVYEGQPDRGELSSARRAKRALPLEEAFAFIAGDDPRPLLVLRECLTCTGTDDALLQRAADNEKTMLMSRWFHCVKLPPNVIEQDHPFHTLFPGDDPGHLFVSEADGSGRLDLNGQQSRTELWSVMGELLVSQYEKKPGHEKTVKTLLRVLDGFDVLDDKISMVQEKIDAAIEKDGPSSRKLKKLNKELAKLESERSKQLAEAIRISRLKLKKPEGEAVSPAKHG